MACFTAKDAKDAKDRFDEHLRRRGERICRIMRNGEELVAGWSCWWLGDAECRVNEYTNRRDATSSHLGLLEEVDCLRDSNTSRSR